MKLCFIRTTGCGERKKKKKVERVGDPISKSSQDKLSLCAF